MNVPELDRFPASITGEQMRAAFDALGLPEDCWNTARRIVIEPTGVRVSIMRRNERGNFWIAGDDVVSREVRMERTS